MTTRRGQVKTRYLCILPTMAARASTRVTPPGQDERRGCRWAMWLRTLRSLTNQVRQYVWEILSVKHVLCCTSTQEIILPSALTKRAPFGTAMKSSKVGERM